jgi:hyperosmotically inducible periplasmic protein
LPERAPPSIRAALNVPSDITPIAVGVCPTRTLNPLIKKGSLHAPPVLCGVSEETGDLRGISIAVTLRDQSQQFEHGDSQMKIFNGGRWRQRIILTTLVLMTAACAATRTREAPGEVIDDSVVTTRVKAALVGDPVTKARQIEVETFRGTVQLSGFVDSGAEKSRAAEIARSTEGVQSVKNNLEVHTTETTVGTKVDDTVITTKVKSALIANPVTKARQINVDTRQGVVQLSGFVDSSAEKAEAGRIAAQVGGVSDVHNELSVKTSP